MERFVSVVLCLSSFSARNYPKEGRPWQKPWTLKIRTAIAAMKSILVIERDGPLQKSLKRLFSSAEEYEVDVVADGTAGLEMLRQRTQVAVLLDIERPVNSEKIARSIPNTRLVILSASSDAADKVLLRNGCRRKEFHNDPRSR